MLYPHLAACRTVPFPLPVKIQNSAHSVTVAGHMKNLRHIKSFKFGYARYHLDDGAGDYVLLKVDYWNNRFEILSKGKQENREFREEIGEIAKGLLSRKHGVEFANKE